MFTIDDIRNDSRFYIDERNLNRLFANGGGQEYRVQFVRVGSILRSLEGKVTTLYDTDVYPFLSGSDVGEKQYTKYCEKYPIMQKNGERYKRLITEMQCSDYDIMKGAIVIDENNFILDGLHRSCITLKKYGPYHKVQVVKCFSGRHYGKKYRLKLVCYKTQAYLKCLIEYVRFINHKCFQ